jgi:hypothetical protein
LASQAIWVSITFIVAGLQGFSGKANKTAVEYFLKKFSYIEIFHENKSDNNRS